MRTRRVRSLPGSVVIGAPYLKSSHKVDPYHSQVAAPSTVQSLSDSDVKSLRSNWAGEARMASVYWSLAEVASNPRAQARLKALSETERRHAQAWAELLASCGVKVSERRPYVTARVLAMLARVAGIGPALALAGVAEGQVLRAYLSQVSTVSNQQAQGVLRRVLPEELDHQTPDDVAERPEDERSPVVADEEWHGGGGEGIRNGIDGADEGLPAAVGVGGGRGWGGLRR